LKSGRIVLAVAFTVIVGLALTAAVGLMMVGALNLISVAFAVLFVGIGVDFGIQFSVRYRAERFKEPRFDKALVQAAGKAGRPLALAAAATAAGFYSFLPTDYRGVSELGRDHGPPGIAFPVPSTAGTGACWLSLSRARGPIHGRSPLCDRLDNAAGRSSRDTFAEAPSFRF
jgi:hypothetical protein